jgi:hypothetical protein
VTATWDRRLHAAASAKEACPDGRHARIHAKAVARASFRTLPVSYPVARIVMWKIASFNASEASSPLGA